MKTLLITGGLGFIGSAFTNYMVEKYPEWNFVNLDAEYYCANHDNITVSDKSNYHYVKGSVQNEELVSYVLAMHQIDTVIHFAAQSHVDQSFCTPLQHTRDNTLGTHVLLECCRLYSGIKLFIHCSTDEVFGESSDGEVKTNTSILLPTNPYAASKAAAEMFVTSYIKSFNLPIVVTRGNNVIGPRQYKEKLIPKFIEFLRNNEKCTIHGNGKMLRSFIYIDDVVRAFETVLLKGVIGETYNIGIREEYSVIDVANKLIQMIKGDDVNPDDWITYVQDRNFNDCRYLIDTSELEALGWKCKTKFDDSLKIIVDQYKHINESNGK
uniref:GDP-mannose 4,6 dehydratase n=1 Tax=Pithovirus LCPAC404 TaxID=2506597 RepID=A0A481ZDZ8_9VIRU|nr:MAG: GDP-mannose 4,6 dehydratase [Pithovirus LCPAC404]